MLFEQQQPISNAYTSIMALLEPAITVSGVDMIQVRRIMALMWQLQRWQAALIFPLSIQEARTMERT